MIIRIIMGLNLMQRKRLHIIRILVIFFILKSWNSADRLWETKCWEEDEALELQAGTYYMILAQKMADGSFS